MRSEGQMGGGASRNVPQSTIEATGIAMTTDAVEAGIASGALLPGTRGKNQITWEDVEGDDIIEKKRNFQTFKMQEKRAAAEAIIDQEERTAPKSSESVEDQMQDIADRQKREEEKVAQKSRMRGLLARFFKGKEK